MISLTLGIVIHASARQDSPAEFLMQRLGLTPRLFRGVTEPTLARWPSIQHWISMHPDTSSFRILDDMASEFPKRPKNRCLRRGVSHVI